MIQRGVSVFMQNWCNTSFADLFALDLVKFGADDSSGGVNRKWKGNGNWTGKEVRWNEKEL